MRLKSKNSDSNSVDKQKEAEEFENSKKIVEKLLRRQKRKSGQSYSAPQK